MMVRTRLDNLTKDTVSVSKQNVLVQDGKEYLLGDIWRRDYVNDVKSREFMANEVEEPYRSIILMMWGDEPTINVD